MAKRNNSEDRHCAFCGRSEKEVPFLLQGMDSAICSDCVKICGDYLSNLEKSVQKTPEKIDKLMTPKEIKACLEMSYELWTNTMRTPDDHIILIENDTEEKESQPKLKNPIFNFDSAAGIDYEVDVTKPYGKKIKIKQMSDGKPFCENRWYNVVMNSYRGNGGGELLTGGAGIAVESLRQRIVWQSDKGQRQCLMEQMSCIGTISPKANNNWRFVPEEWAEKAIAYDKANIFSTGTDHHESNKQP